MKILFYNWDPLAGPAGGGVTAYLTEMLSQLVHDKEYDIWFLNSGRKYTADNHPRLEKRGNPFGSQVQSYEIVNSPILSPGSQSVTNIRKYLEDQVVYTLCKELIEKAGGFDVIHYHNLEGLSLKVLSLKKEFPNIRFVYSFHNYFPVCTQVNLWKDDKENCHTKDFTQCAGCYKKANYELTLFRFQHIDIPKLKDIFLEYSVEHPDQDDLDLYRRFREENISYFNQFIDVILAVSQRTREILVKNGIDRKKIQTMYVGSRIAEYQKEARKTALPDGVLRISYLGYMRKDKGFYFFLDSLHDMKETDAEQTAVTIISRYTDRNQDEVGQLMLLREKFADISLYNGFRDYNELAEILSTQHLGIVPALWEDNLPRVAMEMAAMGLPVLSSDLGGASELGGENPDFIFEAGNKKEFLCKLSGFLKDRKRLLSYWDNAVKLTTMPEHLEQLKAVYSGRDVAIQARSKMTVNDSIQI